MKKSTLLKLSGLMSAIIIWVFAGLLQTATAQEVMLKPDTLHVSIEGPEFETGSPYLTDTVKEKLQTLFRSIEKRWGNTTELEYLIFGKTNPQNWSEGCESDRRWGVNDNWPQAVTDEATLQECGIQNELALEAARSYGTKHFLVKQDLVDPYKTKTYAYGAVDQVAGEATRKTVDIMVIRHRHTSQPTTAIDSDMYVQKDEQKERDEEQNEEIDDNERDIDRNHSVINVNRERIAALEDSRKRIISPHIGIGGESFANQIAPVISAGIRINQVEFSGWYGFMSNAGTATLDIGAVNLRRETYGGTATWYLYNSKRFSIGPTVGWEHGEDAIAGRASYVTVYESALAGLSLDMAILGPLHLRANLSYAPVIKSYTHDNANFQGGIEPIRGMVGISLNF